MELNDFLVVINYVLLAILLVVLIVLGLRLIRTLTKVDVLVDDVTCKSNKLNGIFTIIERSTDTLDLVSQKFLGFIKNIVKSLFRKKGDEDSE